MWSWLTDLLELRLFRYGISGSATFLVNMITMYFLMEVLSLNENEIQRNVSHFLATESSILFSFHAHNFWTWKERTGGYLFRLFHFHLLTGLTVVLRQIGFHTLDSFGQHWIISTILPLSVAIIINFLGYDKWIFRKSSKEKDKMESSES